MRDRLFTLIVMSSLLVAAVASAQTHGPMQPVAPGGSASEGEKDKEKERYRKERSIRYRAAKSTPEEQLVYAHALREKGQLRNACGQFEALVHAWHGSKEAAIAQKALAELYEQREYYDAAFEEYQYLIENFAGRFEYDDILGRQFRIANLLMSERKGWAFLQGTDSLDAARAMFEQIAANGPNWEKTPQAQFNVGKIFEQQESFGLAIGAYDLLEQRYPASSFASAASFRRGCCLYRLASKHTSDERSQQLARGQLQEFLRQYPDHEDAATAIKYLEEVTARLSKMYYERAVFYDKNSARPQAALVAYTDFINKFASDPKAEAVRRRIVELKTLLGVANEEPE